MISTLLLVIIYLAFISLGLPDSLLGSAWPVMYEGMGVPISYAGVISTIIAAGTIVSSFFSDRLIKRFGTGWITLVSVLMTAGALFGFSASGHFFFLCMMAVPLGLGAGSVDAALNNYVALHYEAKHMSWLHCFWGIGATMGPVIMSRYLVGAQGWKDGYRTISLLQFLLSAVLLISISLWGKRKTEEQQKDAVQGEHLGVGKLLKLPGAKPALTAFFCYCAVEMTTGLWGSSYLVMEKGISPETAAKWISLFYFGITFGRFLSGFLTLKWNNRQMVRVGLCILVIGVLLFFIPAESPVLLQGGFFLIGMGCAPVYPSLLHETPKNFGAQYSQEIMGIQMACAYVGTTLVPPLFGFLASKTGYRLFPFYVGILLLLLIFMTEKLNAIKKS